MSEGLINSISRLFERKPATEVQPPTQDPARDTRPLTPYYNPPGLAQEAEKWQAAPERDVPVIPGV